MVAIFSLFWRICTFRAGPHLVPASTPVAVVVAIMCLALNIGVQMTLGAATFTPLRAITLSVVNLAGTAGLIWLVMTLMNHGSRFGQTFTAIMGADFILTAFMAAAVAISSSITQQLATFILTLVTLWTLAVFGYIFHRALEIHIAFGIAMAMFVVIFSVAISQSAISA